MSRAKSFIYKKGRNYSDEYLIMYSDVIRNFDIYKLNIHDLVAKVEVPYITLEVPLDRLEGGERKITKAMISEVVQNNYEHIKQELEKQKELAHNKPNVGRKAKFNQKQVKAIKEANKEGKSIRTLAKDFNCSVGLIHKILNEK